ncbi:MAG TPA: DUF308 domain-containing protein [Polyangia bacterium]
MERTAPYPNGWLLILRGVLAILFGALALAHPLAAIAALVLLFGVWALLDGISALALYFGGWRSWQLALVGFIGIAAAAVTFWRPTITAVGLYAAIAGWAILRGVLEIGIAIKLRREIQGELWLVLAGLSSLVFGVLLIALPMAGMLALAWLIGVYALLFGGLLIALGVRVQRLERRETPFGTPHPI